MGRFRAALPQLGGGLFFAGGGGEWDALRTIEGRAALREHLLGLLELARALDAGFVLNVPVFQHTGLPLAAAEVEAIDRRAIAFAVELRDAAALERPVVLSATLGPFPDVSQLRWLAASEIDLVCGPAFSSAAKAIGFVEAARAAGLPVAVTLAIDPAGHLADGKSLREAVEAIDGVTGAQAAWFSVRCGDPAQLAAALDGGGWTGRIRGIETAAPSTGAIPPAALRRACAGLAERAPRIAIAGLAGGSNLRLAAAMAQALREAAPVPA